MLSFRNKLNSRDPEAIRKISASTGFFDATDIEISVNLAHSALDGQRHANDNVEEPSFLLAEDNGKTVGYACFGKIQDCNSAYELHLISTLSSYRGHGIGRKMIARLLETVRELGGKKLFVKTEGTEQYLPTRKFYESCGFKLEAVLKEYYDDKNGSKIDNPPPKSGGFFLVSGILAKPRFFDRASLLLFYLTKFAEYVQIFLQHKLLCQL